MKRLLTVIITITICALAMAQVPYFGKAPGDKKLYAYTSVKFPPGINNIESYNTFQY